MREKDLKEFTDTDFGGKLSGNPNLKEILDEKTTKTVEKLTWQTLVEFDAESYFTSKPFSVNLRYVTYSILLFPLSYFLFNSFLLDFK